MSWFTSCQQLNMRYEFSWFNNNNSATIKEMKHLSTKMNCTGLITPQTKYYSHPMKIYEDILASVSFWHACPSTCFSRTNCSLSRYNAKCKLDRSNCKKGFFIRLFTPMFTKESNYNPSFWRKNYLLYRDYLTIIKKN